LPQFVEASRGGVWSQALVLGFVFVGLGLVRHSPYALAAGTVGGLIRRKRRLVGYGSGIVYVTLGAAPAFAKRAWAAGSDWTCGSGPGAASGSPDSVLPLDTFRATSTARLSRITV